MKYLLSNRIVGAGGDMCGVCGADIKPPEFHPCAPHDGVIVKLGPVGEKINELLHVLYLSDDECRTWLMTPQHFLDGRVPMAMILNGEAEKVRDLLQAVCDGAYL